MDPSQREFWTTYIAKAQLDLSIAAYTKVPRTWREHDYVPDFNKFYFVIEGEGYLKIGEQQFYPKPGQLYLLPAGVIQSYATINQNTFGKYWCHFSAKVEDSHLFRLIKTPCFIDVADVDELREKFEQLMFWQKQEKLTARIRINAILLEIIALFIEQADPVEINTHTVASLEKIHTVLEYIEEHLADKLTVEELAQHAHFHPNYFIRVFKNTTGLSPIQYVNRMRVEKAKQMLTATPLNVLSIATHLGMEIAYFSRMFKEHTGFAPTDYRELFTKSATNGDLEDW
ncbi:AraC family transcriptional regulator [Alicyclobacillus fodiniaquatilis]|uniref:AraC family transcriptional regulator n=1 Tax=Alicyclobacillus fodiniaquatilis TaxID=1661150 RepID=A0ABW4JL47_9BACL